MQQIRERKNEESEMKKFIKFSALALVILFSFGVFRIAHADMNIYRLYNSKKSLHAWTGSGNYKQTLINSGWNYEGLAWASVNKNSHPIYVLYNPKNNDVVYTPNTYEVNSDVRVLKWKNQGVISYSGGNIPVYRLINKKTGRHFFTTNSAERNSLLRSGWKSEGNKGIAWYSVAPSYSIHYDLTQSTYSGQKNDVHFPQFDYLTGSEAWTKTYSGTNIFYGYNDNIYNFNVQLQSDAKTADSQNSQARQNWTNEQKQKTLAVSDAQAILNTATTKVNEAKTLVSQAQTYVNSDLQHGLNVTADQNLLKQYQTNLSNLTATYNSANTAYQNATDALKKFNAQGTDYYHLSYTISLSNGGKTAKVNFVKTEHYNGKNTSAKFSRSMTVSGV